MGAGLFIALEGIDGAGTTTQARSLAEWLEARGKRVVLTAEPTSGPAGTLIHQILQGRLTEWKGNKRAPVDEATMALLFAADRSDHLQNTILPALEAGRAVVSDRHYLSSVAYQSLGVEMAWVEALNSRFQRPDLTVLLDVDPQLSLQRKRHQGLPAERYEHLHFLQRVRENYLEAVEHAHAAGERVEAVDASPSIEKVADRIRDLVAPLLRAAKEGESS